MIEIQARKLLMFTAHLILSIPDVNNMFRYLTMCLLGRKANQRKKNNLSQNDFTFLKLIQVTEHTGRITCLDTEESTV